MVTTKDLMVPPSSQRMMAKRANAITTEIDSSPRGDARPHPRGGRAFIEKAAEEPQGGEVGRSASSRGQRGAWVVAFRAACRAAIGP
ncbi:hypothetical protein ACRAWD_30215 [Caulobacter segnis]